MSGNEMKWAVNDQHYVDPRQTMKLLKNNNKYDSIKKNIKVIRSQDTVNNADFP